VPFRKVNYFKQISPQSNIFRDICYLIAIFLFII
jgi:hypothetical protein